MVTTSDAVVTRAENPAPVHMPAVSVVVPVYNSQAMLPTLVSRVRETLAPCTSRFEMVLVNDGSRDGSWGVIKELNRSYPEVRGVNLTRNFGQQNALLAGVRAARYEVIVTIDDDLQHPPEEIPKLLAALTDDYDVVYGTSHEGQHGASRDLAARLIRLILSMIMGVKIAESVSAFRAFRAVLREAFAEYRSPSVSIDVLLTWATTGFTTAEVRHDPRAVGRSTYTLPKLLRLAVNVMTAFSTVPLQFASLFGFTLTLIGFLVLAFIVGRFLLTGFEMSGIQFLGALAVILAGAQMFALGIIGEYLARMHFRLMERPPYTIRTIMDATDDE